MSAGYAISGALTGFTFGALTSSCRPIMPVSYGFGGYGYDSLGAYDFSFNPMNSNNDARVAFLNSRPMPYSLFGGYMGMPYFSCGSFYGASPAYMTGYMLGRAATCGWYC